MYLAEDRILCFEIVTKKHEGWMYVFRIEISRLPTAQLLHRLKYVKSAKAATDVPTSVIHPPCIWTPLPDLPLCIRLLSSYHNVAGG